MPHLISFFDYSGNMVRPWAEAGYICYCFDIDHSDEPRIERIGSGEIRYIKADLSPASTDWEWVLKLIPGAHIIFGFPPCDDLAVSGSSAFAAKYAANPNFQIEAADMAMQIADFADMHGVMYMIENPRSVLASLWRKPDYIFNPCDYGGYLPESDVHPTWPKYIAPRDAYTKTTCLWTGNGFQMPKPKFVVPEVIVSANDRGARQYMMLDGRHRDTKRIRNETPRGFALAVFLLLSKWCSALTTAR